MNCNRRRRICCYIFSGNLTGSVTGNAGGLTGTPNVVVGTLGCGNVTSTGDITATNGTFSGNVSIGGTLTYEDVTNIDSVGIVTCRWISN